MELALAIFGLLILVALIAFGIFNQGKQVGEAKVDKEVLDDVYEAKEARDKLRDDPEYADRVRDRFTR